MPRALHTAKVAAEKDAFFEEMYAALPAAADVLTGALSIPARRVHAAILPAYIAKHYQNPDRVFLTQYSDIAFSSLLEAECALAMGLRNAAMASLRSCVEAGFKFLYYETHPIECVRHLNGAHTLSGAEYRGFMYIVPGLCELPFMAKESVEKHWADLCRYVHSDFRSVTVLTVVADLKSSFSGAEKDLAALVELLRFVVKLLLACLLTVEPKWLQHVEKVYYDAVLEAFSVSERREVRERLRIA